MRQRGAGCLLRAGVTDWHLLRVARPLAVSRGEDDQHRARFADPRRPRRSQR